MLNWNFPGILDLERRWFSIINVDFNLIYSNENPHYKFKFMINN